MFWESSGRTNPRVRKSEEFNFTSGLAPRSSALLFGFWLFKYNAIMQVSCLACSFRLFERTFVFMTGSNENKSLWLQHKQLQSKRQSASSLMTSGLTWHSRGMSMLAQSWACSLQLLLTLPSRHVCCDGNCLLLQLNSSFSEFSA